MDDQVDWSTQLRPWLDVFSTGSAAFGLVKDWRSDGCQFTRRGVVIKLFVDVVKMLNGELGQLEKTREVIDIALLVLAVKPSVIKSVLLRKVGSNETRPPSKYADELAAMARGVPSELRLKFVFLSKKTELLNQHFFNLQRLDSLTSSSETFLSCREQLLDVLFLRPETLKRVARSALHSVVGARLAVICTEKTTESESESYFTELVAFLRALAEYQESEEPITRSIVTKHVKFRVDEVTLQLCYLRVTPRVAETAKSLMETEIPVVLSRLNLDCHLISCTQEELNGFVQAITARSAELTVNVSFEPSHPRDLDIEGQDFRDFICMVFKAVGGISKIHAFNIGDLLLLFTSP